MAKNTERTIFLCILICIAWLFVSCDGSNPTTSGKSLKVISNVNNIGSKDLGENANQIEISEILLRFHSDGLFEAKHNFTLDDEYAFYVDYLGDVEYKTDYGMSFNTVLYIPNVIREVYDKMGGKDPNSGNPFWWYMETFLNKDLNEVRCSWKETAEELLGEEGKELPFPQEGNKEDAKWKKRSSFIQYSPYLYNADGTSSPVTKPLYKYVYFEGNYDGMLLFLPSDLVQAYFKRGGDYINNTEAFYWYMEKYKSVSRDEIDRMVKDKKLESYLDGLEYTAPKDDDGITVDENCFTIVTTNIQNQPDGTTGKMMSAVYTYGSTNNLQFKDGSLIKDRDKLYFVDTSATDFAVFVPDSFLAKLKEKRPTFTWDGTSGDLFWTLLQSFGLEENPAEGYTKTEGAGPTYFTREYIAKHLLTKGLNDIT